ncbi:efflux RND transporter periplasmic adaptor subunit [Paenibacillus pinihumi]|uniref:efflux RND transporter periplasmic adaptor subunit n=1 Tax=Paenibacillus pinihumi TaxID=669462 RepID=UPI0004004FEF|nr:efflux RND transporter periplasmic adaptor subunit [Paenibacillus pinihumi]
MKKWFFAVTGVLLVAAAGYLGYTYFFKKEPVQSAPVRTARVVKGNLTVAVSGSGTVTAVHTKDAAAPEEGQLGALLVKEGDVVKEGQIIASYTQPDVGKDIDKLQTSIAKQQMDYDKLKKKYVEANETERENVGYDIESLKLDMASNNKSLAELKEEQNKVVNVTAPMSGKVTALKVAEGGQKVQSGAAVLTITDYSLLQSVIQVDELDIAKVKPGQKAAVTLDALEDMKIEGTVSKIADEGTSTNGVALFDVTIQFPAQEGIRTGMSASAEITVESKDNVLMVPIEAIHEAGQQKMVQLAIAPSGAPGTSQNPAKAGAGDSWRAQHQAEGDADAPANPGQGIAGQGRQSRREQAGDSDTRSADTQAGTTGGAGSRALPQGEAGRQSIGRFGGPAAAGAVPGAMKAVTVGISNDTYIEIVSGLSEGEEIVLPSVVPSANTNSRAGSPGAGGGFPGGFTGGGGGAVRFGGGAGGGGMQRGG